jgi:Bifunctional DNA primase/polymerase, N-terminal
VSDADLTLAAIQQRHLDVALLAPREKKPTAGRRWRVTSEAGEVERHLRQAGNVGLVAGEKNGLAILDPDELLCWADMIDTLGQPCAPWVETGRGRLHYYVAWEPGLPAKLTWHGVIIGEIQRGPGQQQAVIPPSVHPVTGQSYRWLVDPRTEPLPPLPGVWRAYLRGRSYAYSR